MDWWRPAIGSEKPRPPSTPSCCLRRQAARGAYAIRMPPTETPQGARAERGFTQTRAIVPERAPGSGPVTRGDGGVFRLIRDNAPISFGVQR